MTGLKSLFYGNMICLTHTISPCSSPRFGQRPSPSPAVLSAPSNPGTLAQACNGGPWTPPDGRGCGTAPLNFGKPLDSQIAIWPAGSPVHRRSRRGKGPDYTPRYGFMEPTAASPDISSMASMKRASIRVLSIFPRPYANTPPMPRQARAPLAPAQLGRWLLANFRHGGEVQGRPPRTVDVTAQVDQAMLE